MKYPAVS